MAMKTTLISLASAFVATVLFLVVIEVLRRKGMDPVTRLADVVAPPRMNGATAATPTAATVTDATSAASAAA